MNGLLENAYNHLLTTDKEIGNLVAQVEYLRDSVKTIQLDITSVLINRKDIDYALNDISNSLTTLNNHTDKLKDQLEKLEEKVKNHIAIDITQETVKNSKLIKYMISGIISALITIITIFWSEFMKLLSKIIFNNA